MRFGKDLGRSFPCFRRTDPLGSDHLYGKPPFRHEAWWTKSGWASAESAMAISRRLPGCTGRPM